MNKAENKTKARVIVPCFNADDSLEKCVEAIVNSLSVNLEIVLVDDGQNTKIKAISRKYETLLVKTEGRTGAGQARNFGAKGFDGDILIFIDSDVVVKADAINNLIQPILDKEAEGTVGRYAENVKGLNLAQTYKHLYLAHKYNCKSSCTLANQFWTALGAIRADLFFELCGFPELYAGAGPEDIEFGVLLTKAEAKIISVPGAEGFHLARLDLPGLFKNDLRKGTEDIYIHLKHRVKLTDNRNARGGDIRSVLMAGIFSLLLPSNKTRKLAIPAFFIWLFLRSDLILNINRNFPWKYKPSLIPLTFYLDLVRGACVFLGIGAYLIDRWSLGKTVPFNK